MQQVRVWLVGSVQPSHMEILFGCKFAHARIHFCCLRTHPEHGCSHHQSLAPKKRGIFAYHGSLAPDAPLHPAGQAPSLEQATNQLNLASGESGSTHMQLTKRPLQGSCQIWVLQLLCVWVESHVTVRVEQAAFFYIFSTLSIAAASDSLVSLVQLAVLDDAPLEFSYCLKVCRQVLDNSVSPCIWKFLFCIQKNQYTVQALNQYEKISLLTLLQYRLLSLSQWSRAASVSNSSTYFGTSCRLN